MRLAISGGGTAGHVYPALTVLEVAGEGVLDVTWIGTSASFEQRLALRHGIPFRAVRSGPVVGAGPLRLLRSGIDIALGTLESWRLLGRMRPEIVLVTGGYVCVPVALGARLRRVPLAVFLPDVRPGRAVSFVARFADRIATTSAAADAFLPRGKSVVTGYPVREVVRSARRDASRVRLGLAADVPVVLVFGGSQGAERINAAVADAAVELLTEAALVHVAGPRGHAAAVAARERLPEALRSRYHLYDYLHDDDMAAALAAADLAVSRAGAAVLGELPARGLPAILVPLPIASGHQRLNAATMADAGAALLIADGDLTGPVLASAVNRILTDEPFRSRMAAASRDLDRPDAPERIWAVLNDLAGVGRTPAPKGAAA